MFNKILTIFIVFYMNCMSLIIYIPNIFIYFITFMIFVKVNNKINLYSNSLMFIKKCIIFLLIIYLDTLRKYKVLNQKLPRGILIYRDGLKCDNELLKQICMYEISLISLMMVSSVLNFLSCI